MIYSLIETAKANSLDAYKYIEFLLNTMPHLEKDQSPESISEVMPWSDIAIENCIDKKK
ncbi:transposase domain-containing protein [Inconstantimicrobium porci]|uniref:transposase domain-containing protein n=1 Tax=Inconstantimicrobium porci TaxID=2652291 RepID=UPI002E255D82